MRHDYACISDIVIFLLDHQNCSKDSSEHRLDTAVLTPTNNRTKEQKKKTSRGDKENNPSFLHLQQLSSKVGEETYTRPADIYEECQYIKLTYRLC